MAGRIRDEDIKLVRDASPIADIVGEHVTLRNAGGGSLKGLCPFHEEKTPSFNVRPQLGYFHCFGCSEGGDVIAFVMKIDHLTFTEAVERLAVRSGVQLRYEQSGYVPRQQQGQRTRLVAAHQAAAEFYAAQLTTPEALVARDFLSARGFDREAAARFGVGYAPTSWDSVVRHLRSRGFTDSELLVGGLAKEGRQGPIDRFRGRLIWPIRDITGDVVGFGARQLDEKQDSGPKYLNTPETPLYKKSSVLYGVDLAKREIARRQQAVVVEGYTDVMACHLSGVPTAIATCGTAFGAEHIKVLRRLLIDQNEFRGEVIFTFDGDEAGRKAALRAYEEDQKFVTQTFVAVEPTGLDPCELRLAHGEAAVRDLVARRVPLFEFAIRSVLARYDLETSEGQLAALDTAAPIIAGIRDQGLRQRYAVGLDKWLGLLDEKFILRRIAERTRSSSLRQTSATPTQVSPDPHDPVLQVERESLKFALQYPALMGPLFDAVDESAYTAAPYAAVRRAITVAGGVGAAVGGEIWVNKVRNFAPDDTVRSLVAELAVEPLRAEGEPSARYAADVLARLQELATMRRITSVKARLQRLNPEKEPAEHSRLFHELIALEQSRRGLRERIIGSL